MNMIRKLNNYFKSSWLPFKKTSSSKFLLDKRVLFGLKMSEPMKNRHSTAADDGIALLYIIPIILIEWRVHMNVNRCQFIQWVNPRFHLHSYAHLALLNCAGWRCFLKTQNLSFLVGLSATGLSVDDPSPFPTKPLRMWTIFWLNLSTLSGCICLMWGSLKKELKSVPSKDFSKSPATLKWVSSFLTTGFMYFRGFGVVSFISLNCFIRPKYSRYWEIPVYEMCNGIYGETEI